MIRITNADIITAMLAANPKAPNIAASVDIRPLSPKARSFAPSTPPISPPKITSRSVSSNIANRKFTGDDIIAAMVAAIPKQHAAPIAKPTISSPTPTNARPPTTVVVARRMISQGLGVNLAKLEDSRSEGINAALKQSRRDSGTSSTSTGSESEKSGIMCVGIGGSRWASAESRAKEVPRPIEDFYENQRLAMNREIERINSTCSLVFTPTPGALPTRKEYVEKAIVGFMADEKREIYGFIGGLEEEMIAFVATQKENIKAFAASREKKLEELLAALQT